MIVRLVLAWVFIKEEPYEGKLSRTVLKRGLEGDFHSYFNTVSLQALLHFIDLRRGTGAQSEIGAYAQAIVELITPIVPVAIEAWSFHEDV